MSTLSLDLRGAEASHTLSQESPAKGAGISLLLHTAGISTALLVSVMQTTTLPEVANAAPPPIVKPVMVMLPPPMRPARAVRSAGARPSHALAAIPTTPADTPRAIVMNPIADFDPRLVEDPAADPNPAGVSDGTCPLGTVCGTSTAPDPAPTPVVHVGGLIREPRLIESRAPIYPPVAQAARVGGVVILEAHVGRDGRVMDVRITQSSTLFDEAALASVRSRRYEALQLNGVPTEFLVTVTVKFNVR
jgi:protein TonB